MLVSPPQLWISSTRSTCCTVPSQISAQRTAVLSCLPVQSKFAVMLLSFLPLSAIPAWWGRGWGVGLQLLQWWLSAGRDHLYQLVWPLGDLRLPRLILLRPSLGSIFAARGIWKYVNITVVLHFPRRYEYHWADGTNIKKPIKCSAPKYIDYLMTWVQDQLDDETLFPSKIGEPAPLMFFFSLLLALVVCHSLPSISCLLFPRVVDTCVGLLRLRSADPHHSNHHNHSVVLLRLRAPPPASTMEACDGPQICMYHHMSASTHVMLLEDSLPWFCVKWQRVKAPTSEALSQSDGSLYVCFFGPPCASPSLHTATSIRFFKCCVSLVYFFIGKCWCQLNWLLLISCN